MNGNETPQDRPEPRQADVPHRERRYARRIDCAERPRPPQRADAVANAVADTETAPPRDDAHR